MSEVVDFENARKKREEAVDDRSSHWAGRCVCMGCRHEWEGVGPIGNHEGLNCPSCELPKGVIKFLFGGAEGDMTLTCASCGGEALTAYLRKGRQYVRCMACGHDLTNAFFDVE